MRQHKYRGKRLDNGEWVEGNLITYEDKCYIQKDFVIGIVVYDEVDPATVGEFTSLQDKNGVDIYEGDIVTDGTPAYIEFNDGCFFIVWPHLKTSCSSGRGYLFREIQNIEVVGNIYETPELICQHEFEEWEVKEDPICKKCGKTVGDLDCIPELLGAKV